SRNNETTTRRKEKNMKNYITKLPDLRRLNCGFTKNISIIPLATLLVSTLPLLTHLSIAGCSDFESGPYALRIISRLINLLFLDISYCEWINNNILLQFINWEKDLKSLKLLVAVGCFNLNDPEGIKKQLGIHRKRFELWTEIK
ncbi:9178_t:CDS:1, partial [Dentiscutata erythropus]